MIYETAQPGAPARVEDIAREIRRQWPALRAWQAERIARTEAAAVWETTHLNTMVANGVREFTWLVASGPSIGTRTEKVCERCIRAAARSPYTPQELLEFPPLHPNCRCTLLPVLDNWLPPQQPWTGQTLPSPTPAPEPGGMINVPAAAFAPSLPADSVNTPRSWIPMSDYLTSLIDPEGAVLDWFAGNFAAFLPLAASAPLRAVRITDLVSTVAQVSADAVQQIAAGTTAPLPDPIVVAIAGGTMYLVTGHEQVVAAAQAGAQEVRVRYVEVPVGD